MDTPTIQNVVDSLPLLQLFSLYTDFPTTHTKAPLDHTISSIMHDRWHPSLHKHIIYFILHINLYLNLICLSITFFLKIMLSSSLCFLHFNIDTDVEPL